MPEKLDYKALGERLKKISTAKTLYTRKIS
ncbi:hypothetical protein NDGK_00070 [Clostridiales bacterium CHKCI001]|nr:hypothetical protein NDGK_00070 [Clostridiales bacterium CHKCI001]